MKVESVVVTLVGVLASGVVLADGDLVIVCQHAAKVAEALPASNSQITTIVSVVGGVVGLIALTVAWAQMRIASAKTKLDLYNKRFNVYLVALEFYQYVFSDNKEDLKGKSNRLAQVYRESKFLFDEEDKIYETLGKIQKDAGVVRAMEEFRKNPDSTSNRLATERLSEKHADALTNMGTNLIELEKQLKKYLSFHNVRGWTFIK
jgi:hypothetical protein